MGLMDISIPDNADWDRVFGNRISQHSAGLGNQTRSMLRNNHTCDYALTDQRVPDAAIDRERLPGDEGCTVARQP